VAWTCDGPSGEGVDGAGSLCYRQAGLFGQRAGDQIEGRSGVEHPLCRPRIDVDGKFGQNPASFCLPGAERVSGLVRSWAVWLPGLTAEA